jgi:hypothetical protein
MPPYGTGEFDHEIEGGGIELIEQKDDRLKVNSIKSINKKDKEDD